MTEEKRKTVPLSPRLKAQADMLWRAGEYKTIKEVAYAIGVSEKALAGYLKAKDRGIEAHKTTEKIREAVSKNAAEEMALVKARAQETKEEHYKICAAFVRLTQNEIRKALEAGTPLSMIAGNIKALDLAMNVVKKAREERFAVLGLNDGNVNDDDTLPELIISELTPEQVQELRSAQEEDDFLAELEEEDKGVVDTTSDDDEG